MNDSQKRQVIAIHGGDVFATYEEYIAYLKSMTIDFERAQRKGWKSTFQESLGEQFEVISPRLPNANNAKYEEWKIWFEKYIPYMRGGIVLVGHSLGGMFLAKYLSENTLPVRIAATFLVAAPFDLDSERQIVEFTLPESLTRLEEQGGKVYLFQSSDDPVVEFGELSKYQAALPSAEAVTFTDRGHFDQESLPELNERIFALPASSREP
jgi:hypothetical protein